MNAKNIITGVAIMALWTIPIAVAAAPIVLMDPGGVESLVESTKRTFKIGDSENKEEKVFIDTDWFEKN